MKIYILLFLAVINITAFSQSDDEYYDLMKSIDIYGRVYKEIYFNYVDQVNPNELMNAGIRGMLGVLDPYTNFYEEKDKNDVTTLTEGAYGGVGVTIGKRNNKIVINDILPESPAERSGLKIGDVIIKVDDKEATPDNMEDISAMVRGAANSVVSISVQRMTEKITFKITREQIKIKNTAACRIYPENSGNLYLKLTGFNRGSATELLAKIEEIRKTTKIKSVVLDLRDNPGGLLNEAVDICSFFLKKGSLVVSTLGRDTVSTAERKYYTEDEPIFKEDVKLAILIDENSASASEIVAGAIQDHDRGIIVGKQSFGKGLVQNIVGIPYNNNLKITTSRYYTPSGRCIQKIDYAKDNKAVITKVSVKGEKYLTDNKRTVLSGGGIKPDSTIDDLSYPKYVSPLLMNNYLFNFCNEYYYKNSNLQFKEADKTKIFDEFADKLGKEDVLRGNLKEIESEFSKFIKNAVMDSSISNKYNDLLVEISKKQLEKIISEKKLFTDIITYELSRRYFNREEWYLYTLTFDKQFNTTLNIMNNEVSFKNLLRVY